MINIHQLTYLHAKADQYVQLKEEIVSWLSIFGSRYLYLAHQHVPIY